MTDRDSKSKSQADLRQPNGWMWGLAPQNGDLGPYSRFDEHPGIAQPPQVETPRDDWAGLPMPDLMPPRGNYRQSSGFGGFGQTVEVLQSETEGRFRFRFVEFSFRRRKYKSRS